MQSCMLTFSYHSDSKMGSCNKLFTNWVLVPYKEIQALGFPNSPRKLGLYEKPWACISWYGPCTQLVNSKYQTSAPKILAHVHQNIMLYRYFYVIKVISVEGKIFVIFTSNDDILGTVGAENEHIYKG